MRRLLAAALCAALVSAGAAAAVTPAQARRVVVGSSGWLFIAQDWTVACQDTGTARWTAGQMARLRAALLATGRDAVVTIVRELPTTRVEGLTVPVRRTTASGGRVVPGRTVFVGDSFHDTAVGQLAPLFEEAVFVWTGVGAAYGPAVALLADADRVVVETVERFAPRAPLLSDAAIAAVAALPPRWPARLDRQRFRWVRAR